MLSTSALRSRRSVRARQAATRCSQASVNPTPLSNDEPPDRDAIRRFVGTLRREGANVTIRDTRGKEIDAACGQLRMRSEPHRDGSLRP